MRYQYNLLYSTVHLIIKSSVLNCLCFQSKSAKKSKTCQESPVKSEPMETDEQDNNVGNKSVKKEEETAELKEELNKDDDNKVKTEKKETLKKQPAKEVHSFFGEFLFC